MDVKNSSAEREICPDKGSTYIQVIRLYNKEADELLKEALLLEEDGIFFAEDHDGHSGYERFEF